MDAHAVQEATLERWLDATSETGREGRQDIQIQDQQTIFSPTANFPICKVCYDLDRHKFEFADIECLEVSLQELSSTAQGGCLTCSVAFGGISEFCSSLSLEHRRIYNVSTIDRIYIIMQRHAAVILRVNFCVENGPLSILLLELFSLDLATSHKFKNAVQLPTKLDLSNLVLKVKAWIENCNANHVHCRISDPSTLPARVLDVGRGENYNDIKLAISLGNAAQYVALSYCWGNGENMIRTTKSSITMWTQSIPWQRLPKTFQDAITITRALGIRYLWIDALCIIQDDIHDWEIESANMANVYSNSYLTIGATAASNSHTGLFHERWTSSERGGTKLPITARQVLTLDRVNDECVFIRPQIHLAHDRFKKMENATYHTEDAPLPTRGWAFQERLLPSRTLHFHAEELIWECKSAVQCECTELDQRYSFETNGMGGWLKNFVTGQLNSNRSAEDLGFCWLDLVSEFSALHLTFESDRLPALSGLASEFSNKALGTYIAGLWENDLARGLLFETVEGEVDIIVYHSQTSAPSWSWASIHLAGLTSISYSRLLSYGFIQDQRFWLVKMYMSPNSSNPFSWVSNGLLEVKGACTMAIISCEGSGRRETQERKMFLEVGGVRKGIPLDDFRNDGPIHRLDNITLFCILIGHQKYTGIPVGSKFCEYVLVLQKSSAEEHIYKRVGLLLYQTSAAWTLKNEPALRVLIG